MPRKLAMSWEGEPYFRWVKMWKGTRYRVGCHELPITRDEWTKEQSASFANDWWEKKLASLQVSQLTHHPHSERIVELNARLDYAKRHGLQGEAKAIDAEISRVRLLPPDADPTLDTDHEKRLEGLEALGVVLPSDPGVLRVLDPKEAVWSDRFKREPETPPDRTIGALAERWVSDKKDEARKFVRSDEGADALRRGVGHFRDFVGASSDASCVTADMWHKWYVQLAGMVAVRDTDAKKGYTPDTASKYFTISRSFVKWLWEREILDNLPRNLNNKQYKFERPEKAIPTFSNKEVKTLVNGANGMHRLLLLLMLNTGATQKDIGTLRKDQIDLKEGRITRCRSKTSKKKSGRVVSYKLWDSTLTLLKEHLAADGDLALLTKSGKPWVWTKTLDNNKMKKSDNMASIFNNLKKKLNITEKDKSLKIFRKTSATRLKGNKEYRDLRFLFLGHSTKTVADRNYAAESQEHLDNAMDWLYEQYFN